MLLKQNQQSACDGEQLEIKCNDDYVIEIITAELTILHREQHGHASNSGRQQDNRVTTTSAGTRADPSPGNQTAGPVAAAGEAPSSVPTTSDQLQSEQRICPALENGGGPARGPNQPDSAGQTGNGTQAEASTAAPPGACSETEAQEASLERKAKFWTLVKKQCSLLNSCLIDLRLAAGTNRTQPNKSSASSMSQFLTEKCPLNRKLFEMAYKCKPTRFRSKVACRNSRLALECSEPGKRLAIGTAIYGFWPEDKKARDRCQSEEERALQQQQQGGTTPSWQPAAGRSNCSNSPTPAINVLSRECLFKQQCQLQVQPSQLASCPAVGQQQPLEYLKVVYVCVNEEQLITTNVSVALRQSALSSARDHAGGKPEQSPPDQLSSSFASPNVSSSMLLATPQQQFITPPANVGAGLVAPSEPPPVTVTVLNTASSNRHSTMQQQQHQQQQQQPPEDQTSRIFELLNVDPQLSSVHPSNWTPSQRVKFVLLRYQRHLIAFAVITISVSTLMALVARFAFGRRSSRQSNASSASSSKSSSASATVQKSFGSSSSSSSSTNCTNQTACTATVASHQLLSIGGVGSGFNGGGLAGAHQHHLLAAHQNNYSKMPLNQMQHGQPTAGAHERQQPTNSCSESCFSLDDCNCSQQQGPGGKHRTFHHHHHHQADTPINNNSPALQSSQTATPPIEVSSLGNCHLEQQRQQPSQTGWTSTLTAGGARPKLWSFYVNEQHSNSLRLGNYSAQSGQQLSGGNAAAATLRTQRTFSGQPQPALARNFECLQRQDENLGPIEPHQSEYLLAMASVGQQYQQLGGQQAGPTATGDGWCHQDGGQRMHLLTLTPAELLDVQQQQQQPLSMSSNMTGPTCAFHSQQQQHQHQVSFMTNELATGRNSRQPIAPMSFEFDQHPLEIPPQAAATAAPSVTTHQFQQQR